MGKFFWIVIVAVLAAGTYFSVHAYKTLRNTPERITQTFVQDLEAGNTDRAYERLSADLKKGREQYWKDFIAQFKAHEGEATLASQEYVDDTFNTYPTDSEPQRFVYKLRMQGKDYVLQIVTYKIQNVWIIGELLGSYK
ncbi:MAG: hypothetical protein ABWX94_03595 [Candidatus Saccharimonadales bacterium]